MSKSAIIAFHGSAHDFDRFSVSMVGNGQGERTFGWGLYFAADRELAEWYRKTEAGDGQGILYEVKLPPEGSYLLWDKPLAEHPPHLQAALRLPEQPEWRLADNPGWASLTGEQFYGAVWERIPLIKGGDEAASRHLSNLGICGIYFGRQSRTIDNGGYVIFDDQNVEIIRKWTPADMPKPLTRRQFQRQYAQHIDIRNRQNPDTREQARAQVLATGFRKGANVNALPPYRGGKPYGPFEALFAPKAGDVVYLAPEGAWKHMPNGMEIQDGWIPKPYEVIRVTADFPDMYEEYLKAFAIAAEHVVAKHHDEEQDTMNKAVSVADTIDVDGQLRPTLNSEGNPIHASEEGIRNFWRWFKDSAAVDAEGRPLVLYHMSKASEIAMFDPKRKTELSSFGFHFGTREQAEFRATQFDFRSETFTLGAYYLAIPQAFPVTHMGSFAPDHLADLMMAEGMITDEWYEKLQSANPYGDDVAVGTRMVKVLTRNGYAGLVYDNDREGPGKTWVPFAPEQIKSATHNPGSFDPNNPAVDDRPLKRRLKSTPTNGECTP